MNNRFISWTISESEGSFRKKLAVNILRIWKSLQRNSKKIKSLEAMKLSKNSDLNAIVGEEE
jgi:hypothetical protein